MAILNFDVSRNPRKAYSSMAVVFIGLLIFPFFAAQFGNSWVRIIDMAPCAPRRKIHGSPA